MPVSEPIFSKLMLVGQYFVKNSEFHRNLTKKLVADSRHKWRDRRGLQERRSLLFRKERLASELDPVQPQWQNACLLLLNQKRKQM